MQCDRSRCIERGYVKLHERSRLCAAFILARSRTASRGNFLGADRESRSFVERGVAKPGKPAKSTKLIWGYSASFMGAELSAELMLAREELGPTTQKISTKTTIRSAARPSVSGVGFALNRRRLDLERQHSPLRLRDRPGSGAGPPKARHWSLRARYGQPRERSRGPPPRARAARSVRPG